MFNKKRTFGIEIECVGNSEKICSAVKEQGLACEIEGYNHITKSHWKIVTDASVHPTGRQTGYGLELVSPILKGQDGFNQLKKVCMALEIAGAKVNVTCGLHVHHGAEDFKTEHFRNIVRLYHRFEDVIDTFVSPSRRGDNNDYCRSIKHIDLTGLNKQENSMEIGNFIGSRYHKLNLHSFITHGTIEFRQHQGTVEFDKIANWVKLTQTMVERAVDRPVRNGKESTVQTWESFKGTVFLNSNPKNKVTVYSPVVVEIIKFYTKRRKELAA